MSSSPERYLVTGGAGFIGSHIVEALAAKGLPVRVLDNLSTGRIENLASVHDRIEFVEGSILDQEAVTVAAAACTGIFHLAAAVSVQESISDPVPVHQTNALGTLHVIEAARAIGARVVFSSSAAVYGDDPVLPKTETMAPCPISPYGIQKLMGEQYLRAYHGLHGLGGRSLRYFNVYGPRQRPDATYAAVIPLFVDALLNGRDPEVHGDGHQSRDFTYISDVVAANLAAAGADEARCSGHAYNIAAGSSASLLDLLRIFGELLGVTPTPRFVPPRAGDVRRSQADASAAARDLGFRCTVGLDEGLRRTVDWLRTL